MNTCTVLLLAAFTVCTIARPPAGPTLLPGEFEENGPLRVRVPLPNPKELLGEYLLPRYLISAYANMNPVTDPLAPGMERPKWWRTEALRLYRMENGEDPYEEVIASMTRPVRYNSPFMQYMRSEPLKRYYYLPESPISEYKPQSQETEEILSVLAKKEDEEEPEVKQQKEFASTPLDKEFYTPIAKEDDDEKFPPPKDFGEVRVQMMPPRNIRQNPNLSRQKTLVAENLDRLRAGLHEISGSTDAPRHIHVMEATDPAQSIYGVAFMAAIGAALTMTVVGFAVVGYKLSKRAKAAADVDYPAYGVTGPTADPSGDRKLAHSAHMYHYQHQKQQIIAMERNGGEKGNPSVSDPESEEENEEGDYTVYEWPGFATTGDMEVKNPLFNDDPTPATPGKCEIVKPQPKE